MIMKRFETLVSDFFLYIVKRLERNDEIWYNKTNGESKMDY